MKDAIQPGFYKIVDPKALRENATLPNAEEDALVAAMKKGHTLTIETLADPDGNRLHANIPGNSGRFNGAAQNFSVDRLGLEAVDVEDVPRDIRRNMAPLAAGLRPIGG
ncbi:MAG: hypothetical protein HRT94_00595 [Alphaproteobacteria bacterium]|nr:hypothetical protein [Alphaproteobacteria bacterium]